MAKSTEEQQIETKYGLSEGASYTTLLSVLERSIADYNANHSDKQAIGANLLVFKYASPENQLRLHAEFGLAQNDLSIRNRASQAIAEYLSKGGTLPSPLRQQVANQLWSQVKAVEGKDRRVREFISQAADILLYLGDNRGLEVILANKTLISNLMATDKWSENTTASSLRTLEQQMREVNNVSPVKKRKAEIYRLLAARKDAGVALEPSSEIQNLALIYQ